MILHILSNLQIFIQIKMIKLLISEFSETYNFIKNKLWINKIQIKKRNSYTTTIAYNFINYIQKLYKESLIRLSNVNVLKKTFVISRKIYKSICVTHNLKYYRINNCIKGHKASIFSSEIKAKHLVNRKPQCFLSSSNIVKHSYFVSLIQTTYVLR